MKKRVRVEVPFFWDAENKKLLKDDEIEVSEETLASIRAVNVNMVTVLGDVPEEPEEEPEISEETEEEAEKPKTRKPRAKKTEE